MWSGGAATFRRGHLEGEREVDNILTDTKQDKLHERQHEKGKTRGETMKGVRRLSLITREEEALLDITTRHHPVR